MKTVDELIDSMYSKRLDPNADYASRGWKMEQSTRRKNNPSERIAELLAEGKEVKTGYFATSVRAFHEHWILSRSKK